MNILLKKGCAAKAAVVSVAGQMFLKD